MSFVVRAGKAAKKFLKDYILISPPPKIRYTRRIERIKTARRICAMTFDDGPMNLPAAPDRFAGKALTDVILDTLADFGARGTFDIIGDTSDNYPDEAGKIGSPAWGGVHFDHYPDFQRDSYGGALHNDRLIRRILNEGHQITNHGYRHILFGKKSVIYGKRVHYGMVSRVEADLKRLDHFIKNKYDYQIKMGRPPHYVDKIRRGFTSYDVYERLNYQYLGASFDGAGWLPSNLDGDAAIEAEVNAMTDPIRRALEKDPDFFCGQIIFQKDGYNMAKRTPVAIGLPIQLEILQQYGYQVVTVDELMEESPFADLGREDPLFDKLYMLSQSRAVVFADNRVRLEQGMTMGELAMLIAPRDEAISRRWIRMRRSGKYEDPYRGAMDWCIEKELFPKGTRPGDPVKAIPDGLKELFASVQTFTRRALYDAFLKDMGWNGANDDESDEYNEIYEDEDGGAYVENDDEADGEYDEIYGDESGADDEITPNDGVAEEAENPDETEEPEEPDAGNMETDMETNAETVGENSDDGGYDNADSVDHNDDDTGYDNGYHNEYENGYDNDYDTNDNDAADESDGADDENDNEDDE